MLSNTKLESRVIKLFLCGDVMLGRGIDQVLPHPGDPRIHESYVRSALGYVELAERANGAIPKPVDFAYVWGDALAALAQARPDVRVINLETAVTRSNDWVPKGINYRMHPENVPCITAAGIDCCVLGNNHVLDWGPAGLEETLASLKAAGLETAGAGRDSSKAGAPAVMTIPGTGRVVVFSMGVGSSGIPREWAATPARAGVNRLPDLTQTAVEQVAAAVRAVKLSGDVVVASIHWGGNWGYRIPASQREFARRLIDEARVDVVHGHSSHHPKGIEVHRDRPIIYGCGDFLNDYEGIGGHETYRGELTLMYFLSIDAASGRLLRFKMTPMRIRRFRLQRASLTEARWLGSTLDREGLGLGTRVALSADGGLVLGWD